MGVSRKLSRSSGAVLPEFALSSAIFFILILGGIELCRGVYTYASLNLGILRAARAAATGVGPTVADVQHQVEGYAQVGLSDFKLCKYSDTTCASNSRGTHGDWMQVQGAADVRLFGFYNLNLTASTVFRNEQNFRSFVSAPTVAFTGTNIVATHPTPF